MGKFKDFVNNLGNQAENIVTRFTPWGIAKQNTDKTIQANKEMAEYQYSKDLEMWNRGNTYNSPTAQMDRLKQAGLNPNLVYGQGVTGNSSGQLPKYNAPTLDYNYKAPLDPLAMLGAFQNFRIGNAQLDNLRAQNRVIQEEGNTKNITNQYLAEGLGHKNTLLGQNIDKNANLLGWQMHGGLENIKDSNLWKGLNADLSFRQGRVKQQESLIDKLDAEARLKGLEGDLYDWKNWSQILQGFGVKIPSFRGRK